MASCLNETPQRLAAKDDDSRSILQKLEAIPTIKICTFNFVNNQKIFLPPSTTSAASWLCGFESMISIMNFVPHRTKPSKSLTGKSAAGFIYFLCPDEILRHPFVP